MCSECEKEYKEKGNIRRHAQTIACHDCGPQLRLITSTKDTGVRVNKNVTERILAESVKAIQEEKILAMTTQVTYEGSHINTYAVGRRIADSFKILEARDMTLETIIAKLMWILGNSSQTWDEIEQRFYTPVAMDSVY
jgi:hypothetical protein